MLAVWALWRGCDRVHCEHSCPPASGDVCVLVATGTAGNWNCAGYHAECCSNPAKMGKTNKSPLGCKYLDYFQWPVSAGGEPGGCGAAAFFQEQGGCSCWEKGTLFHPRGLGAWQCHQRGCSLLPSPVSQMPCGSFRAVAKCPSLAPGCFSASQ